MRRYPYEKPTKRKPRHYPTAPPRQTRFVGQFKVDVSGDGMKTVTDHIILTEGSWLDLAGTGGDHKSTFCMVCCEAPEGLPMTDETTPIGSPFKKNNYESNLSE
tara:strand:- start:7780 stop:8091 length:312 start_codon:yes stop_codon:yes gene_type:complete